MALWSSDEKKDVLSLEIGTSSEKGIDHVRDGTPRNPECAYEFKDNIVNELHELTLAQVRAIECDPIRWAKDRVKRAEVTGEPSMFSVFGDLVCLK